MNNNPSPGNKAGGLTTILEKSLGAVAKGGTTNLVDVYEYAQAGDREGLRVHGHAGLRPGVGDRAGRGRRQHDLLHDRARLGLRLQAVAVAQARDQHADVRSGRKTTWTSTAARSSTASMIVQEAGERIFELILATASGQPSKSERIGFGAERIRALATRRDDVAPLDEHTGPPGGDMKQSIDVQFRAGLPAGWLASLRPCSRPAALGADQAQVGARLRDRASRITRRRCGRRARSTSAPASATTVEVFPASTLGKETDINQGLTLGTVDIIYTGQLFAGRTYGPHRDRRRAVHVPRLRSLEGASRPARSSPSCAEGYREERRQQGRWRSRTTASGTSRRTSRSTSPRT